MCLVCLCVCVYVCVATALQCDVLITSWSHVGVIARSGKQRELSQADLHQTTSFNWEKKCSSQTQYKTNICWGKLKTEAIDNEWMNPTTPSPSPLNRKKKEQLSILNVNCQTNTLWNLHYPPPTSSSMKKAVRCKLPCHLLLVLGEQHMTLNLDNSLSCLSDEVMWVRIQRNQLRAETINQLPTWFSMTWQANSAPNNRSNSQQVTLWAFTSLERKASEFGTL